MIRVGILYGGRSGEHDVSRCSAASVVKYLDPSKYEVIVIGIDHDGRWYVQDYPELVEDKKFGTVLTLHKNGTWYINHYEREEKLFLFNADSNTEINVDVVFPVVHGTFCEDGTLQGLLELAMVPYVGADVIGSAIGMDKDVSKRLLRDAGIPVVDWIKVYKYQWDKAKENLIETVIKKIGFPCFIKPCNAGSSVGISKVNSRDFLDTSVNDAFQWDNKILIEKGIDAREIEFSIIGNEIAESSIPGEIRPRHEFYSYEAKYIDSDGADFIIPADINSDLTEKIKKTALDAYHTLCCSGMARVDFFLEKNSEQFYLNEINTLPGFTSISMYPKLWDKSGINYSSLLDKLIELAFIRKKNKNRLRTDF